MTLSAGTVWEVRITGGQQNGGGFANVTPGTSVDYSQQPAPQLSLADIATDAAGTQLTSATGGFTEAMEGNCIHLTGGGATAGWYQVPTGGWIDANNITIDRTAGANKVNVTGDLGGAFLIGGALDDEWIKSVVAGNKIWIKAGTYNAGEQMAPAASGSSNAPIRMIGYSAARNDNPMGSNRPLINITGLTPCFGSNTRDGWSLLHLRFAGNLAGGGIVGFNKYTNVINCSFLNVGAGIGAGFADGSFIVGSEFQAGTTCLNLGGAGAMAFECYFHNGTLGISVNQQAIAAFCCVKSCTEGIDNSLAGIVINCTIWGCTTGVVSPSYSDRVINTIIDGATTGINVSANALNHLYLFNQLHNTTDINSASPFLWGNRYADPGLNNPAGADFRIAENDPPYAQAMEAATFTTVKI
jgi:hypothetical protein